MPVSAITSTLYLILRETHYITLHYITFIYILHYIKLHYTPSHHISIHIALHYILHFATSEFHEYGEATCHETEHLQIRGIC